MFIRAINGCVIGLVLTTILSAYISGNMVLTLFYAEREAIYPFALEVSFPNQDTHAPLLNLK